jgi:hypothetical protein
MRGDRITLQLFTLQGKLVKTLEVQSDVKTLSGLSIARGVYIVKRDGGVPSRLIVGSGTREIIQIPN